MHLADCCINLHSLCINIQQMNAKYQRLALLKQLIGSNKASSQEDLLSLLAGHGLPVTQATLSRDLKELKAAKIPDGMGGYHYRLAETQGTAPRATGQIHIVDDIRTIEFSGQMCVIHTLPGYANMVAAVIDNGIQSGIMGTIAGDDTVLVILKSGTGHDVILNMIENVLPGVGKRLVGEFKIGKTNSNK